jgi:hypothetical protein
MKGEAYRDMLVGIAIFVGGMIAVIILMKYLTPAPSQSLKQQTVRSEQPMMLKPLTQNINVPVSVDAQTPVNEFSTRRETANDQVKMLYDEQWKGLNWTSCDVTNIGPDPVYLSVNNYDNPESPIYVGQSVSINLNKKNAIKKIYLKCDHGKTATVDFYILK